MPELVPDVPEQALDRVRPPLALEDVPNPDELRLAYETATRSRPSRSTSCAWRAAAT